MKWMMLLVVGLAAFLSPSTYAAEPSLASVMAPFSKQPNCDGARSMGARFTLITSPPNQGYRFIVSDNGAVDTCLEQRRQSGIPGRQIGAGARYYEFKVSGRLNLNDTRPPGETAEYELTLGQPPISPIRARPDLGTLVITYSNGTSQRFTLPDSLTITPVGLDHFIYGEIGGGTAVISILIGGCGIEGCNF